MSFSRKDIKGTTPPFKSRCQIGKSVYFAQGTGVEQKYAEEVVCSLLWQQWQGVTPCKALCLRPVQLETPCIVTI